MLHSEVFIEGKSYAQERQCEKFGQAPDWGGLA